MRIAIREQLAVLVLLAVLVALTIVSVPTWIYVNNHIATTLREGLALTASLKAARISADLDLVQTSCFTISSRILIQNALQEFYTKNASDFSQASTDIRSALSVGSSGLLQARLFSRNSTGASSGGLLNVTAPRVGRVKLPYTEPDGSPVFLNDTEYGYPPTLYPDITYQDLGRVNKVRKNATAYAATVFDDVRITAENPLLLGPLIINETAALLSITIPVRDNEDTFVLGYMTVVAMASSLVEVRDSREGLGESGMVLVVGPTTQWNRFENKTRPSNATHTANEGRMADLGVHFILPPKTPAHEDDRHSERKFKKGTVAEGFPMSQYPAALDAFVDRIHTVNNASALLDTHNEQDFRVSVGFARTVTKLVDWAVIVEKSRAEAYEPIATLRNILLGTVFGTAGFIALIVFPCAHLSVLPIRKLKAATENSVNPPGYDDVFDDESDSDTDEQLPGSTQNSHKSQRTRFEKMMRKLRGKDQRRRPRDHARRMFQIPAKVEDRKHLITDELTELTRTFNRMSDELLKQYQSLDTKVADRTRELEESKKAAEAANQSKTLFIANISHELKTPLNGIMGMCSVLMEDNDMTRIKQSLKVIYKSGDLLFHLLEDLLSFSKNQIGQQLNLELREFRLGDLRAQIVSIFDKQVREGKIDFSVDFLSSSQEELFGISTNGTVPGSVLPALGPMGAGRLKDMCLWGDQHRILQVIINLVSNSLKFTPAKGKVSVRIRCLGEQDDVENESRTSSSLRNSRTGRTRQRKGSSQHSGSSRGGRLSPSVQSEGVAGTALSINPLDPKAAPYVMVRERSPTPPPSSAKTYVFEFEVEDTGPGIPEHMQQKVFEPFVQGDLGLSKQHAGTGLGLSICHQLAGLMGGSISLSSTVGKGTTFTMRIPLKYVQDRASSAASSNVDSRSTSVDTATSGRQQMPVGAPTVAAGSMLSTSPPPQPRLVGLSQPFFAGPAKPASKSADEKMAEIGRAMAKKEGGGKLRVLVADDNPTNVEVVSRMLKLEDVYDVTIAKDGQEAFELVKATMQNHGSFDVIFMDVQMPNVDGLQSTRLIREMGYTSPIVALTAFSEESNVRDCINSGMDEFLSKPIKRPALKQVLKKFATIPEEPETASVATRRTSVIESGVSTSSTSNRGSQQEFDERKEPIVDVYTPMSDIATATEKDLREEEEKKTG